MASPHAVPDEVQAALSGMMEQVAAISAAPTDAERERQYDVLAGMLATATAQGPATEYLAGGGSGAEEFVDDDEDARFAIHCAAPQSPRPEHREAEASAKAEAEAEAATAAAEARARWGDDSEESEDEPAPPAVDAPGSQPAATNTRASRAASPSRATACASRAPRSRASTSAPSARWRRRATHTATRRRLGRCAATRASSTSRASPNAPTA